MAKRIQMRKQRFMAIQKIAEQKKLQAEGNQSAPGGPPGGGGVPGSGGGGGGGGGGQQQQTMGRPDMREADTHSHTHGHSHSHGHPHKQQISMGNRGGGGGGMQPNMQPNVGSRGCSLVGPLFQEVRFKVHDPKAHSKGGTLENTINGGRGPQSGPPPPAEPPADAEAPPTHLIHPGKVSTFG